MAVKRIQALVSGRVHGVGYRYFAVHAAKRLGLPGTVRNLPTGDVEVIAEGDEALLGELIDELRTGPSTAGVREVQVAWGAPEGRLISFTAVS
jgi:acylphosphatase